MNSIQEINKRLEAVVRETLKVDDAADETLDFIEESFGRMPEYFNAVIAEELGITMARVRYEDNLDAMHNAIERYDKDRRAHHELLAMAINQLNRLACILELPKLFETPEDRELDYSLAEDREIAADLCYNFCKDAFLDAKAKEKLLEQGYPEEAKTRNEREAELYQIEKNHCVFNNTTDKVRKIREEAER